MITRGLSKGNLFINLFILRFVIKQVLEATGHKVPYKAFTPNPTTVIKNH
jgi:hypothetical protein